MRFIHLIGSIVLVTAGCGDDGSSGGGSTGGSSEGAHAAGGSGHGGGAPGGGEVGGASAGGGGAGQGGGGPGGMGPGFSCEDPVGSIPPLALVSLEALPGTITAVKSAPGEPDRLFVADQDGYVRVYEDGVLLDTPFLDVSGSIRGGTGSEEGLLGIAFHPDYASNGRFFVHYSRSGDGYSTVMEFHATPGSATADPEPVQLVLSHDTAFSPSLNGGGLEFGNDGYLFISLGDGGDDCDPGCDAMNPNTLLGKISRVDVDAAAGPEGYPAAPGNPSGEKFYHTGLRNPWRISIDACSGDLFIGDVGQSTFEEVDAVAASAGPQNFGWPVREALHPLMPRGCSYDGSCQNPPANPTDPIVEYDHNDGCAVIGGVVYRGSNVPPLRDHYLFGDFCTGAVRVLRADGGTLVEAPVSTGLSIDAVTAFGIDGHGEVYAGAEDGSLYRIDAE